MATSQYFPKYEKNNVEQDLMEDNIVECIQLMGHDLYYIPRESYSADDDKIFGENAQSKFTKAYFMEMYPANVEGYEGDGDFFSKFGLEVRDNSTFVVARRTFEKYVPDTLRTRPREGDLIWAPTLQKLFEVTFIEEELMFFSLGKDNPYVYELRCEVFRYSNEDFNTGIPEIDELQYTNAYTVELDLNSGSGNFNIGEIVYQGANLNSATASAMVKNWKPSEMILEVINIKGEFSNTSNIIGLNSGVEYSLSIVDELSMPDQYENSDNRDFEDKVEDFIVIQENPFGKP